MSRVLVIDDDPATASLLLQLLTDEGHQARAALGYAAVALAADWQPHLILLDLMMPAPDGFALRRAFQADPRTRALPIVVMSAGYYLDEHSADLPVQGLLPKPFDLDEVLAWVDRVALPAARSGHLAAADDAPGDDDAAPRV